MTRRGPHQGLGPDGVFPALGRPEISKAVPRPTATAPRQEPRSPQARGKQGRRWFCTRPLPERPQRGQAWENRSLGLGLLSFGVFHVWLREVQSWLSAWWTAARPAQVAIKPLTFYRKLFCHRQTRCVVSSCWNCESCVPAVSQTSSCAQCLRALSQ